MLFVPGAPSVDSIARVAVLFEPEDPVEVDMESHGGPIDTCVSGAALTIACVIFCLYTSRRHAPEYHVLYFR